MMFLYLLPTGMNDPNEPTWGSWGGRHGPNEEHPGKPYFWANQTDTWQGTTSRDNTLARWAAQLQNDFRARMDWCVADSFDKANHAPRAVLNGDTTNRVLRLSAKSGEEVRLSAAGSSDPDGHALQMTWFVYPEAGTFQQELKLTAPERESTGFVAPIVHKPQTLHVLLQLDDQGSPSLTAYRRVVFTLQP
jgi:hypothetical protein